MELQLAETPKGVSQSKRNTAEEARRARERRVKQLKLAAEKIKKEDEEQAKRKQEGT
jgi:hypothetical protein